MPVPRNLLGYSALVPPRSSPSRSRLILQGVLLLVVGTAVLWFLIDYSGREVVRSLLSELDPTLAGAALLLFVSQSLTVGVRWWIALRLTGHPTRLVSCIRANSTSNIINFLAPGHFGEPIAASWLGKTHRGPGVESFALLVACKAVATVINLVALIACIPLLLADGQDTALTQAIALTALSLLLAGGIFVSVLHPTISAWGIRAAGGSARLLLRSERAGSKVEGITQRFRDAFVLFSRKPSALALVSAVSVLKVVSLIAVMALIYGALGTSIDPFAATFLQSVDGLGNIVSIWIPGNLGLQEAVHSSAAVSGLALDRALAVSAALLVKLFMIVHTLFGGVLWLVLRPLDPPGQDPDNS